MVFIGTRDYSVAPCYFLSSIRLVKQLVCKGAEKTWDVNVVASSRHAVNKLQSPSIA